MGIATFPAKLVLAVAVLCGTVGSLDWHFTGLNVAQSKNTTQGIGTHNNYGSDRAVDGNTNPNFDDGSCSHTSPTYNSRAFWTVYLERMYILKGIRIYNRKTSEWWGRHKNFKISGKPSNAILHDDATTDQKLYNNLVISIAISSNVAFDEITFEIPAKEVQTMVTLCEVQIFTVIHDCHVVSATAPLNWNLRAGTGYMSATHGVVSPGSVIDFNCSENYNLVGEASIICLANGIYNGSVPKCQEIECTVEHLRKEENFYELAKSLSTFVKYNESLFARCKDGYKHKSGDWERICLSNKTFAGEELVCEEIECTVEHLRKEENFYELAKSLSTFVKYNESLFARCKDGYKHKSGDWERICLSNKTFAGEELVCEESKDDSTAAEVSSIQPAALGGSIAAAFVVGVGVGLVVAYVLWNRRGEPKRQQPEAANAIYCTPTAEGSSESHVYLDINELPKP